MIKIIVDSEFRLDGGSMNGIVPRVLWSNHHPPDERGRIQLVTRALLYKDEKSSRLWLVEAGIGDGWDEKQADIYGLKKISGGLMAQLKNLGITPEDITDIVLTHLHFDHCAGVVTRTGSRIQLAFPNAKIYVQKKQMDWALSPSMKDMGSYRKEDVEFMAASKNLVLLDGAERLSEDVSVTTCFGHTEGMQIVTVKEGGETFVAAADLIPLFSHVRIPWIMALDNQPLGTLEEKKKFLKEAARAGWILVSGHDAQTDAATIKETGENKYKHTPVAV